MASKSRLQSLLEKAIALDGAAKGNIQALSPEDGALRIVCQIGFDQEFLRHFAEVKAFDSSACGRAFGSGGVVLIPDVEEDPGFAPHRGIAQANGFRSVKSMPVVDSEGRLRGVLSTHSPFVRWDWERENTRRLAEQVGDELAAAGARL